MLTDYRKPSEQILLDLVNYHNASNLARYGLDPIRGRDVLIGQPVIVDGVKTKVLITPRPTAQFVHPFWFTYNRVNLSRLLHFNQNTLIRDVDNSVSRISDVIQVVNARWQINLDSFDYVDADVDTTQYDVTLELNANTRSLVWVGSVDLLISRARPLADVIVNRDLLGFALRDLAWYIKERDLPGFTRV